MSDNLFGLEDWESLFRDVGAVWEQIECDLPEPGEWTPEDRREWEVLEWSAKPLGCFITPTWRTLERIGEDLYDEVDEFGFEQMEAATHRADVVAAFEYARALLASHLTGYSMADKIVARHTLSLDENHQPLVNGEPLYKEAAHG